MEAVGEVGADFLRLQQQHADLQAKYGELEALLRKERENMRQVADSTSKTTSSDAYRQLHQKYVDVLNRYDELKESKIAHIEALFKEERDYANERIDEADKVAARWRQIAERNEKMLQESEVMKLREEVETLKARNTALLDENGDLTVRLGMALRNQIEVELMKQSKRPGARYAAQFTINITTHAADQGAPSTHAADQGAPSTHAADQGAPSTHAADQGAPSTHAADQGAPSDQGALALTPLPPANASFRTPAGPLIGVPQTRAAASRGPGSSATTTSSSLRQPGIVTECNRVVQMLPTFRIGSAGPSRTPAALARVEREPTTTNKTNTAARRARPVNDATDGFDEYGDFKTTARKRRMQQMREARSDAPRITVLSHDPQRLLYTYSAFGVAFELERVVLDDEEVVDDYLNTNAGGGAQGGAKTLVGWRYKPVMPVPEQVSEFLKAPFEFVADYLGAFTTTLEAQLQLVRASAHTAAQ